jgi:tetratricopeptide (TPR) repeat protein
MPNTQHHTAKWLRLTEMGYQRLSPHLPNEKGASLYRKIANPAISKNTVGRILKREQPVQLHSIETLFRLFGLKLLDSDIELFKSEPDPHPHFHVPPELSEWFVGRAHEIKSLRSLLLKGSVAVLSGLGGIGKTQTALNYCHLHKEKYQFVFWLRAESEAEVQQGYAEIAGHLGLPGAALSEQERAAAAVQWLGSHPYWLLVLDNLDQPASGTLDFPSHPRGHTLITTRLGHLELPTAGATLPLRELNPSESLKFLLTRCRRLVASSSEKEAAAQLAEELGHLPLALEQAAAYIVQFTTFANYLALYRERRLGQLEKKKPFGEELPDAVATTWEINFQRIEEEAQTTATAGRYAAALLRFSAFLAPDDIPMELVMLGAKEACPELHGLLENAPSDAAREEIYNEALEPLTRYSLVTKKLEDHTFSLHRLVQAVTRERLPADDRQEWQVGVVRAVDAAFPLPIFVNRTLCERLLPHATVVRDMIAAQKIRIEASGHLLGNMGRFFFDRAQYTLAESYYEASAEIQKVAIDADHYHVALGFNNLAMLRHYQRRFPQAISSYEDALRITHLHFPDASLEVAMIFNNLGGVYMSAGEPIKATESYKRSLALVRQIHLVDNEYAANVIQNLGLLSYHRGQYDKAERFYLEALKIWRRCQTSDYPEIGNATHNLAQLYRKQSAYDQALPLYREAIRIQTQAYPAGHPHLSTSYYNLAELYKALRCYAEARENYEAALEVDLKVFGKGHPEVAADQKALDDLNRQAFEM